MENKKEQSTASSLLRFAGPYKGKYILSIFCLCWASLRAWFPIMPQHKC